MTHSFAERLIALDEMDEAMEEIHVQAKEEKGLKYDDGKPRLSMLFSDLLAGATIQVVRVLEYGANKYAENNWAKVEGGIRRYQDALLRHATKRVRGEVYDDESGLPHMAHVACCALFILALEQHEKENKK